MALFGNPSGGQYIPLSCPPRMEQLLHFLHPWSPGGFGSGLRARPRGEGAGLSSQSERFIALGVDSNPGPGGPVALLTRSSQPGAPSVQENSDAGAPGPLPVIATCPENRDDWRLALGFKTVNDI